MFFKPETRLTQIKGRINLLRARGEQKNFNLINALTRQARNIEKMIEEKKSENEEV